MNGVDQTYDFIVVGSGGGSMCAALVLRAAGKSVLILEKTDKVGGTTATSGGVMWIPNNRFMKDAGVPDSTDQAMAYLDAVVGDHADAPGASRERRRTYVEQAPKMIDFLVSQGIRLRRIPSWPDFHAVAGQSVPGRTVVSELFDARQLGAWTDRLRPGFLPLPANLDEAMQLPYIKRTPAAKKVLARILGRALLDRLSGRRRVTAGQALQAQMLHAALKAGVEVQLQSPVRQLVVKNDRVVGVITERNGDSWHVGSRLGVLINAGGFARNQAMLDQYIPGTSASWSSVIAEDTGDMITEGQRLGAAVAQMGARIGTPIALPPGDPPKPAVVQNDICKPHAIVVDGSGARYTSESGSYAAFSHAMLERHKTVPAVPSYLVVDSQFIRTYMLAGSMPGAKKPKAWTDSGFLRSAATLEGLAQACGMDPATLRATVERFNGFARANRDEDFHRGETAYDRWSGDALTAPAESLGTLEEAPFYALQIYPGDVSTYGGLVTDAHARVLRPDGSVIAGLYATGTSTASVMGMTEAAPGSSVGPTFTWGYLAARHVLESAGAAAPDAEVHA